MKLTIILGFSLVLFSCSEISGIKPVVSDGHVSFELLKNGVKSEKGRHVYYVKLFEVVSDSPRKVVKIWHIENDCLKVNDYRECPLYGYFEYGTVPEGFSEVLEYEVLVPNRLYQVSISGGGFYGGASFEYLP